MELNEIYKYKHQYLLTLNFISSLVGGKVNNLIQQKGFAMSLDKLDDVLYRQKDLFTEALVKDNTFSQQINAVTDFSKLLKAIPETSYETRKIATERLTEIYKIQQEENLYSPSTYYDIYFNLVGSNQENLKYSQAQLGALFTSSNENFNLWFGKSKVVQKGVLPAPRIVYHGSGATEFTKFNFDTFPVAYFAEKVEYSEWFQKAKGTEGVLFSCFLSIQNPIDLTVFKVNKISYDEFVGYIELKYGYKLPFNKMLKTASERQKGLWAWQYIRGGVEWLKLIKNNGYFDGFHYYENNPQHIVKGKEVVTPAWAIFRPEQVKSANGNVTFSYDSEDIRFKSGGKINIPIDVNANAKVMGMNQPVSVNGNIEVDVSEVNTYLKNKSNDY